MHTMTQTERAARTATYPHLRSTLAAPTGHSTQDTAYSTARSTLAAQARMRAGLAARHAAGLPALPDTSGPVSYVTQAQQDTRQAARAGIRAARHALVQRHRVNTAARHGSANAATSTVRSTQYLWLVWRNESRKGLSYGLRDLVRWVRSSEVKASLPFGETAALPVPVGEPVPTTSKPWRGLVNGSEVRVNTRGAYGKRGIRAAAERVTQRDTRTPVYLLKPLPHVVVGCATHPAGTGPADYETVLHTIRQRPTLSTYRALRGPVWPAVEVAACDRPVWSDSRWQARTRPVGALQDCGVVPVYQDTRTQDTRKGSTVKPDTRAARDVLRQQDMGSVHSDAA
jgi:hypothetical protein